MLEKKIEGSVCDYAVRKGMWCRKYVSPARRGAPDRIFAYKGRVFWIEFKKKGGVLSPLQRIEIKKMRDAGLTVYVCDDVAQGKKIIDAELNYDANAL